MKFVKETILTVPEILKRKLGGELIVPITIAEEAFTDGVCKAGNAISADGTVVDDDTAIGILLNDVYDENPNGPLLKAFGEVNLATAEAHSGNTITSAVKEALPDIKFA